MLVFKTLYIRYILILVGMILLAGVSLVFSANQAVGAYPKGETELKMKNSPQWHNNKFQYPLPRKESSFITMLSGTFHRSKFVHPTEPIPYIPRRGEEFRTQPVSGLRITWLGHSATLIEIDGKRFLLDPMGSRRASPFSWIGPKRFYPFPLPLKEMPPVDAIVLSHDHYDHLDKESIQQLNEKTVSFIVPLGVGSRLISWGIPSSKIHELDWWQSIEMRGIQVTATPARHFSGRSLTRSDSDKTLWASWAFVSSLHRVFFSGDTAMMKDFKTIGDKLGPFDVTLMEIGSYSKYWPDVHIGPEQAIIAHTMLRGKLFVPVHWATFNLSIHGWTEPIERVIVAAEKQQVRVAFPRPGESFEPSIAVPSNRWWPDVPWETAQQNPIRSTGL